jgi:hypothetical protein
MEPQFSQKIPQIITPDWSINNIGKVFKSPFVPGLSGIFNIKKAKELEGFRISCYGLDFELALKFCLAGKCGFLNNAHRVFRRHLEIDSINADINFIYESLNLVDRVYNFGIKLNLPSNKLKKLKSRVLAVFLRTLLLPVWMRIHGYHLNSIYKFFLDLKGRNYFKQDHFLIWRILISSSILKYALITLQNDTLYSLAKTIYWLFRKRTLPPLKRKLRFDEIGKIL